MTRLWSAEHRRLDERSGVVGAVLSFALHALLLALARSPPISSIPLAGTHAPAEPVQLLDIAEFPASEAARGEIAAMTSAPDAAPGGRAALPLGVQGHPVSTPASEPLLRPTSPPTSREEAPVESPDAATQPGASDFRWGRIKDPRLLLPTSGDTMSDRAFATPGYRADLGIGARISSYNDSVAAAEERDRRRMSIQVGSFRIRVLKSADDFVDFDPTWVAIRDQEAERARRELLRSGRRPFGSVRRRSEAVRLREPVVGPPSVLRGDHPVKHSSVSRAPTHAPGSAYALLRRVPACRAYLAGNRGLTAFLLTSLRLPADLSVGYTPPV